MLHAVEVIVIQIGISKQILCLTITALCLIILLKGTKKNVIEMSPIFKHKHLSI